MTALTRSPLKRTRRKPKMNACQEPRCRKDRYLLIDGKHRCPTHAADRLVGNWVKARDRKCLRCGAEGPLDWAHVISRSYKAIRWSVAEAPSAHWNNSIALCRRCHFWQTNNPLEGEDFFASLGIDYDNLKYLAKHDPNVDPLGIIEAFAPLVVCWDQHSEQHAWALAAPTHTEEETV